MDGRTPSKETLKAIERIVQVVCIKGVWKIVQDGPKKIQ